MKYEKINRQHHEDEGVESNPQPRLFHVSSGSCARRDMPHRQAAGTELQKEKGETLRIGACATRAKVSPNPSGTNRTVRGARAVLTIRPRSLRPRGYSPSRTKTTVLCSAPHSP